MVKGKAGRLGLNTRKQLVQRPIYLLSGFSSLEHIKRKDQEQHPALVQMKKLSPSPEVKEG